MNSVSVFVYLFAGLWGLIGAIFLIIGIVIPIKRRIKEKICTSVTKGIVSDIEKRVTHDMDSGPRTSWYPVFEYNIDEQRFIKQSIYGYSQAKFGIGQEVEIHYNPNNYNDFYVADDNTPKAISAIFIFIGILGILIASVTCIFAF